MDNERRIRGFSARQHGVLFARFVISVLINAKYGGLFKRSVPH